MKKRKGVIKKNIYIQLDIKPNMCVSVCIVIKIINKEKVIIKSVYRGVCVCVYITIRPERGKERGVKKKERKGKRKRKKKK